LISPSNKQTCHSSYCHNTIVMTQIKIVYHKAEAKNWCGDHAGGVFKSALNLACYDKRYFASVEIDSELEHLNTIVSNVLRPSRYIYIPSMFLFVLGTITTIIGLVTSFNADSTDWILVTGLILLLWCTISFLFRKLGMIMLQKKAFAAVNKALTVINIKYRERGLKWKMSFPRSKKTVNTSKMDDSFVSSAWLTIVCPTIYIELPGEKRVNSGREHSLSVQIEMGTQGTELKDSHQSKKIYCTHCGHRAPVPTAPLSCQPLCEGCQRPLELPAKYFVDSASDGSASSSPSFNLPTNPQNFTQSV